MNEARLSVGFAATAIASAAYYAALEYAQERPQGRAVTSKDPTQPQIPIIEHADIKRMLLCQRAIIEGSLSLLMQCTKYSDLTTVLTGQEKEKYQLSAHADRENLPRGNGDSVRESCAPVPGRIRVLRRFSPGAVLPGRAHPPDPRRDYRHSEHHPAGKMYYNEKRESLPTVP